MVRWHHQLNGHEFEQTPGEGEGQGSLACYSPWGCKELYNTEQFNKQQQFHCHKGPSSHESTVFPVVRYGCESWTINKAECRRIDAFALWCWRRLLWVPWTARRSNQSILKEISPEYSLEGLMLKLQLQQDEMAGWHHWLNGHEFESTLGADNRQGGLECSSTWSRKESDSTERLNWTEHSVTPPLFPP